MLSIFKKKNSLLFWVPSLALRFASLGVSLSMLLSPFKNCPSIYQGNFQLVEVTYKPIYFFNFYFILLAKIFT